MQLTGSEIVIECLKEQGVDTVFGYPGGTILNIYDELYKHSDEIHHILTSHEQGAAHAADGYARSTGKVGVCFATSGPGATNLVTGIATAFMDSVPVVAVTCNVGVPLLGKDSFQEVDIAGVVMPITKHSFIVKDVTKLAKTLRRAFAIAKSGRPGPVLVDITKDVTAAKTEYTKVEPKEIKPFVSEIKEEAVARLRYLSDKVGEDMKISLEFCGAPNCSINQFGTAYDVVKAVDRPNVGITVDTFHFHEMCSKLEDLKKADGNKIFAYHLNDCEDLPLGSCGDDKRLWPGEGVVDHEGIATALKEIGFDGVCTIEEFRPEYYAMSHEENIKKAAEVTKAFVNKYFG